MSYYRYVMLHTWISIHVSTYMYPYYDMWIQVYTFFTLCLLRVIVWDYIINHYRDRVLLTYMYNVWMYILLAIWQTGIYMYCIYLAIKYQVYTLTWSMWHTKKIFIYIPTCICIIYTWYHRYVILYMYLYICMRIYVQCTCRCKQFYVISMAIGTIIIIL